MHDGTRLTTLADIGRSSRRTLVPVLGQGAARQAHAERHPATPRQRAQRAAEPPAAGRHGRPHHLTDDTTAEAAFAALAGGLFKAPEEVALRRELRAAADAPRIQPPPVPWAAELSTPRYPASRLRRPGPYLGR
jgi:hypothetical protein